MKVCQDFPEVTELSLFGNRLSSIPPELGSIGATAGSGPGGKFAGVLAPRDRQPRPPASPLAECEYLVDGAAATRKPQSPCANSGWEGLTSADSGAATGYFVGGGFYPQAPICFGNPLGGLPPDIGKLSRLRWLGLYGTGLSSLPLEIGRLQELEHLDLAGTRIRTVPLQIGLLPKLAEIKLPDGTWAKRYEGNVGKIFRHCRQRLASAHGLQHHLRDSQSSAILKPQRS